MKERTCKCDDLARHTFTVNVMRCLSYLNIYLFLPINRSGGRNNHFCLCCKFVLCGDVFLHVHLHWAVLNLILLVWVLHIPSIAPERSQWILTHSTVLWTVSWVFHMSLEPESSYHTYTTWETKFMCIPVSSSSFDSVFHFYVF